MKILIVDDEPKIRKGLCKIVEMHPGWYVPQAFADAESAIAFLRDNGADVVITDIHMPGLTGLDMIEQMRSACPKVVFIILTGYGKFEYAQRAIDLGVKKYLMKPTSPNEITAALEQIEADTPRKKHAAAFQKPTNNLIILRAMEYVDLHYRDRFTLRDNGADVVITDIHMPGLTGLDMIEQMRSACPKVVFIILTGYGKFEYAQRAIDLGVKKYLMKPTSPNEITAALEQIEADTPRKKHAAAFQKPTNNLIILRAMEYVDLHYRDRFTLRDMAAALYISPNYLSDLFKKNTGMRLSDYITEVRLEKAREYLMDVHYKVRDVSTLVGISDPRYFSSVFRKKYGMTPMEFRNEYASRQFEEPDPEEN